MNRLGRIARHLTYESDDSVLRCVSETAAAAVPETKTRYAIVGLGGRSVMYSGAILSLYTERAELVGICDINRKRMEYYIDQWTEEYGDAAADINLYSPSVPTHPRPADTGWGQRLGPAAVDIGWGQRCWGQRLGSGVGCGSATFAHARTCPCPAPQCRCLLRTGKSSSR